ncbi:unnamed protein product [Acanthoscelides obtectus]|uniref:Uncharacterized protein n=1 Tax=Acanthoscelides obtectus TaxID=200917 RepID=A0A9P0LP13_ACAOB|nr:unnamed protein product [Acanthoscelides obtectus]CAK1682232.1 hypothetical protein AOBTE_LOCUS33503 [Acanthoscelides obtectus]
MYSWQNQRQHNNSQPRGSRTKGRTTKSIQAVLSYGLSEVDVDSDFNALRIPDPK